METTPPFPVWYILLAAAMLISLQAAQSALHEKTVAYIAFTAFVPADSGMNVAAQPAGTVHT